MPVEQFDESLKQAVKYNIKFNENLPLKSRWYIVLNDKIVGVDRGDCIFTDEHNTVLAVSYQPKIKG